jgi:MFS family permease
MKMSQAGAYMGILYLGYVITQIPGGMLADRFGARIILGISLLIGGIATIAMGSINSFSAGLVLRFIAGLALGADFAAAARAIIEWFRPEERGKAFGALFSGPMVGIMLASVIVVPLNHAWGWRWAFRIVGIIAIVIAIFLYNALKKSAVQRTQESVGMFAGFPIVFSNKNVLLPAVAGFCTLWVQVGTSTWVFTHIKRLGFGMGTVSTIVLLYGLGGVISPFITGWLSDKFGHRKAIAIWVYVLTIPATIIFGYQTTLVTMIVWGFIFGFISYGPNPHLTIFISEAVERKHVGLANGTGNLIYQIAPVTVPVITGWALDVTGKFTSVWWILAAGPLVAIFLLLPVDTKRRLS